MKKVHARKSSDKTSVKHSARSAPVEYQVTTAHGDAGISQPFASLAGAQRALEKVRHLYPDAFISTVRGTTTDRDI